MLWPVALVSYYCYQWPTPQSRPVPFPGYAMCFLRFDTEINQDLNMVSKVMPVQPSSLPECWDSLPYTCSGCQRWITENAGFRENFVSRTHWFGPIDLWKARTWNRKGQRFSMRMKSSLNEKLVLWLHNYLLPAVSLSLSKLAVHAMKMWNAGPCTECRLSF